MKDTLASNPPDSQPPRSVEDLQVFKLAHHLVLHVYQVTSRFPREERFGLTAPLRRAAASVVANLAEGAGHCPEGGGI